MTDASSLTTNPRFAEAVERIRAHAQRMMDIFGVPGFAIALTDRHGTLATIELGVSDREAGTPVTPDTLFETGSIDKSVTAALALQLADEGRIDLDAPVRDALPWFEIGGDRAPFTPRHLLTHTAGIIDGMDHSPEAGSEVWSLRHTTPAIDPGTRYLYSNLGYKVLGLMLEHVTGTSFQELVIQRVFEPLGIRESFPAITDAIRNKTAVGYVPRFGERPWQIGHGYAVAPWLETGSADGCFAMTASDLAIWLRTLLNRGAGPDGKVLAEAVFERMTKPSPATEADDTWWYACGIERTRDGEQDLIAHDGDMVGYSSAMMGDLVTGVGVVALCNVTYPYPPVPLAEHALALLRAVARGEELPPDPPVEGESTAGMEDPVGTWRAGDDRIAIERQDDGLYVDLDGRRSRLVRAALYDDDDLLMIDDPDLSRFTLWLERDEAGTVVACRHGHRRFSRAVSGDGAANDTTLPPDVPEAWHAFPGHYRSHSPWASGFRVVLRAGELWKMEYWGSERRLLPDGDGFREGSADSTAWLRFVDIAGGRALRVEYENGAAFHRVFLD